MTIIILALMFDNHIPIEKRRQSESTQWWYIGFLYEGYVLVHATHFTGWLVEQDLMI